MRSSSLPKTDTLLRRVSVREQSWRRPAPAFSFRDSTRLHPNERVDYRDRARIIAHSGAEGLRRASRHSERAAPGLR
jgi:hypothetical protein